MYTINHEVIANIPVLHVVEQNAMDERRPTVFFIHGFTSAKEHNLHYAYLLAKQGFRVYLPEVHLHGERQQETTKTQEQLSYQFWDLVMQTIDELDVLKNELIAQHKIDEHRIGVAGVSMGGIITLGALRKYKWIQAAVSLMGCPSYQQFARALIEKFREKEKKLPLSEAEIERIIQKLEPYDLSLKPDSLQHRPLLFWHGKADPVVPYTYAHQFYIENKNLYDKTPEKLQFHCDNKAGHKVTRQGVLDTIHWFQQFL